MLFDLRATSGPRRIDATNAHLAIVERLDRIVELLEGIHETQTQVPLRTTQEDEPDAGSQVQVRGDSNRVDQERIIGEVR